MSGPVSPGSPVEIVKVSNGVRALILRTVIGMLGFALVHTGVLIWTAARFVGRVDAIEERQAENTRSIDDIADLVRDVSASQQTLRNEFSEFRGEMRGVLRAPPTQLDSRDPGGS